MIKVESLSKSFKDNLLLKNLSFNIDEGEKICFVSDSGKGKSTIIKILLGLECFDKGTVSFNNTVLNAENISSIRNIFSWLPQDLSLQLSMADDLNELLNLNAKVFSSFIHKLNLDENLLYQNFQNLSGGQKQKILIAACLSLEKPILFLDEPTSALDKKSIILLINTIWKNKSLTVISSSHNKTWINACDKIIYL